MGYCRFVTLSWLVLVCFCGSVTAETDPQLPEYHRVSGISGNLSSVGSDTLANMMTYWGEAFYRHYPSVNIQIQAAGSSTAPPALIQGTSDFGPMSRLMNADEIEAFVEAYGYPPTPVRVAIDAIAVFVHKDNPLTHISVAQLDAIYSNTRYCGAQQNISTWGQLGLGSPWRERNIQMFGRNSVSGTYGYFKERGLCRGDYKPRVNEQPGSASVIQSVSTSLNGIGYSGLGYLTAGVRAVPVMDREGRPIRATLQNTVSGEYPLARYLYVYVNKHPDQPLQPLKQEFLRLILSAQGQGIVDRNGYVALPNDLVQQELRKLGITPQTGQTQETE